MSAKTHPRLVGAFVLGAVALVLAAIVLLSSGGLFQERPRFVVFFPGSVKGLQTGSQVTFRGVRVGAQKTSIYPRVIGRTPCAPTQLTWINRVLRQSLTCAP